MHNVTVVIAAGGRATRLRSAVPKSLLTLGECTYLQITLDVLSAWSFRRIVVATNRPDFLPTYRAIANSHPEAIVVEDCGVTSTLELARDAAVVSDCSQLLFLYGHAPRPFAQIESLFEHSTEIVASSCNQTTKRSPIHWHNNRFLEPPYLVNRALLAATSALSWEALFQDHRQVTSVVEMPGPGEFNDPDDLPTYENYVRNWTSPHHRGIDAAAAAP